MSGFLLAPCWFITIALHYSLKSGVVLSSSVLLLRTALAIWVLLGRGGEYEDKAPVILCLMAVGFGVLGHGVEKGGSIFLQLYELPQPALWKQCLDWRQHAMPGPVLALSGPEPVGSNSNSSNCFWTLEGNPSVYMCSCSLRENWCALGVSLCVCWHRAASIVTVASVNSCSLHCKEAVVLSLREYCWTTFWSRWPLQT